MAKQTIDALVQGGKASAAPPLGPALGPLGVNIGQVIAKINEKTSSFAGMQVPVKVTVDDKTKEFTITIGTPPASALIKKEAGVEAGASNPKLEKVADLKIEQVIKVAKMKHDDLLGKDMFAKVKEIIGTCNALGILVEGKPGKETIAAINAGAYADEIKSGKTEITEEERKALAAEKLRLQEEAKKHHDENVAKAKTIMASLAGKENRAIRKALLDSGLPLAIVNEVAPAEEAPAAAGAKK